MEILDYLLNNWKKNFSGGNPVVSNNELHYIAMKIKNQNNIAQSKKKMVDKFPFYGPDNNTSHVRYDSNVCEDEKVSGLCEYLEWLYNHIIAHIQSLFGSLYDGDLMKIDVILSKDKPKNIVENDVAMWLKKQFDLFGEGLTVDKIREIINSRFIELMVCGKFVCGNRNKDERPYIVIYYRNTNITNINQFDTYLADISKTFAHEYFHFYHYLFAGNIYKPNMAWGELAVTESLADIFAYDFLMTYHRFINKKMRDVAIKRYKFWDKYFGSSIAYAEAIRYIMKKYIDIDYSKMLAVFKLSKSSMLDAFMELTK
jgi:hypothetical protein